MKQGSGSTAASTRSHVVVWSGSRLVGWGRVLCACSVSGRSWCCSCGWDRRAPSVGRRGAIAFLHIPGHRHPCSEKRRFIMLKALRALLSQPLTPAAGKALHTCRPPIPPTRASRWANDVCSSCGEAGHSAHSCTAVHTDQGVTRLCSTLDWEVSASFRSPLLLHCYSPVSSFCTAFLSIAR